MRLDNIYNYKYGSKVSTNGNFIAIGNPPGKEYDICEGFGRIGQVFLIKKDKFNSNYVLHKIFTKQDYDRIFPYFTEDGNVAPDTGSFFKESGSFSDYSTSGSLLVLEEGNTFFYNSKYGESLDLCDYFLAIGDPYFTSSFETGVQNGYASVDIFEINPNYTYNTSSGIKYSNSNQTNYTIPDLPICSVTGSISDLFGTSVSISNNYLAIGAPNYNNGRGIVYLYKYTDNNFYCKYSLETSMSLNSSDYPHQKGFGFSLCFDKKDENKLIVGSNQLSQSNVYLYFNSGSSNWTLTQTFSQNTSSQYYKLDDADFTFYPSGSQINSRFGYSVSLHGDVLSIGAPNDLIYYEYSGSNNLRQRGSVYVYSNYQCTPDTKCNYRLLRKIYGDKNTFKDNLLGFDVSTFNNKLLIGSPKPYFPFSSLFISESINFYNKTLNENDLGESTYCGQSLLYDVDLTSSIVKSSTTIPISKRKEYGQPYTAYGYSVSTSNENLVIGAPIPLNDDFHLSGLTITESGSASDSSYINTSSYQSDSCLNSSRFVYSQMEDCITCSISGNLSGACDDNLIVFADEIGEYLNVSDKIFGKAHVYDFEDLQKDYNVGNVFYNNNKIIINNTGSILSNLTLDPVNYNNSYLYMDYESQITLFEKQYICTIEPGEFNISTNPTAITSSTFDYGLVNKYEFDFNNLDLVLRYINYKITNNGSEKWWNTFISDDLDQSLLSFYTSSVSNFTDNRLSNEIINTCENIDFDVNKDGVVTTQDGFSIWKYFIQDLTLKNYQNYINPRSKRKNYDDIIYFLNEKTGKNLIKSPLSEFFDFKSLSSTDTTGSYLAPYITTVGLYSGADLVAVAKLAHPIKNTGEIPINIVVKWDT